MRTTMTTMTMRTKTRMKTKTRTTGRRMNPWDPAMTFPKAIPVTFLTLKTWSSASTTKSNAHEISGNFISKTVS